MGTKNRVREEQTLNQIDKIILCSLRNKYAAGDELEAVGPDLRPFAFRSGDFETEEGELCQEIRTPRQRYRTRLPRQVPPWTILRHRVDLSAK